MRRLLLALLLSFPATVFAATGDTLLVWTTAANEPPATDAATFDATRNSHLLLDFDTTTEECGVLRGVMPQHYGSGGVTVLVHASMATATTGTLGWLVSFERIGDSQQDLDADGFAAEQTITAVTVPGTSGLVDILSVDVSDGASMDSVAVGESFRLKVCRDVDNDTAAGDAELSAVEIQEQ